MKKSERILIDKVNADCESKLSGLHEEGIKRFGIKWLEMQSYAKLMLTEMQLCNLYGKPEARFEFLAVSLMLKGGK